MTGRRATLDDSTVCGIEKVFLIVRIYFVYLFIFIEGNAVSVINLNHSICMKNFMGKILREKLSEMVKSEATSNSTRTTKVIQKQNNK